MDSQPVSISEMLKQSLTQAMSAEKAAATPAPEPTPEAPPAADEAPEAPAAEEPAADEPADAAPTETAPVKPAALSEPDLEKRLQKLSAASQRLVQDRQQFAQEREQHKAALEEVRRFKEIIQGAKEDPVSLAELAGFEPTEYATTLLEKGSLSPERKRILELDQKLKAVESRERQRQETDSQERSSQLEQRVMDTITKHVAANSDKYEYINALGRHRDVMDVITQHYNQTRELDSENPEILTYDQAAEIVEDRLDKAINPILQLNKIKTKLGNRDSGSTTSAVPSNSAAAPRKSAGTITGKMRASATPTIEKLSESERLAKAGDHLLMMMQGKRA